MRYVSLGMECGTEFHQFDAWYRKNLCEKVRQNLSGFAKLFAVLVWYNDWQQPNLIGGDKECPAYDYVGGTSHKLTEIE